MIPKYLLDGYSRAVADLFLNRWQNYENPGKLAQDIVECEKCPRLRAYAKIAARNRPKRFADWIYWGKPVPGFGDLNARVLIIGLAPASSGALRTGRIFTGDASSRFLVRALHSAGFANQAISESVEDGLEYTDCYLTAAVKCAPPGDKPTGEEFDNCSPYLDAEISLLRNLKVVLALGSMAFRAYVEHLTKSGVEVGRTKFAHGVVYRFPRMPALYASYHPSPRNTNTGKLTPAMLLDVLTRIKGELGPVEHISGPTRRPLGPVA
ncbi:MAG: uracil-DNA glycosylase [Thaumarchaeota archaeon]|nr:uracil-DNA glycosylase [Nitrososphaerota archaeon]